MTEVISFPFFLFQPEESDMPDNRLAYLTDKTELKTIVSHLCKQLQHPVALIDYNALMKTDTTEKLESMVEMFPMRRSCSIFRKCAGDKYCTQCDYFHARYMDVDKDSIVRRIQNNIDQAPPFFNPDYKNRPPIVLEGFDRPVIEYHCPMLGYRELLFPLMYRGSVYGVFFAGQIMVYGENDQEVNRRICESFFNHQNPEVLFKTFVKRFNAQNTTKLTCQNAKELIIKSDERARRYDEILGFRNSNHEKLDYSSKNFSKKIDYYAFIDAVCRAIFEAEEKLSKGYEERRKRIVSEELVQIADQFFEEYGKVHSSTFKNRHEASTEELNSSWNALEIFASSILNQFNLVEKALLFGDRQGIKIETTGRKELAFAIPNATKMEGSFDFSLNTIDGIGESANSLKKPEILEGLSEGLPKENSILIQCHDIAMLIQVSNLDENKEMCSALVSAIEKELVRINSIIALCSANLMKEKYLLTLRMYRHENAHISTRLMGNINRYFANGGERFREEKEQKQQLVCNDLKNTVQLISNIADNLSFVTGTGIAVEEAKKNAAQFNVADMLYKWQSMFGDELENRNLEIIVYRGGYDSSTVGHILSEYLLKSASEITRQYAKYTAAPNEITINARLFELLVYNIVDNAVKYAYRGTNIYLIWSQLGSDYELSVTSYGPQMPESDDMYGLYVRGNDERILQGDGLGLYVVKKIAEKLSLQVSHKSERISSYNAPLIAWYSKTNFSGMNDYPRIKDSDFSQKSDAQQVLLATNKYPPTEIKKADLTPAYMSARIQMETWRTTFRIIIPMKNK